MPQNEYALVRDLVSFLQDSKSLCCPWCVDCLEDHARGIVSQILGIVEKARLIHGG